METHADALSLRMARWAQRMEEFSLPDWEDLPSLELYMDQVIILLTQYLQPMMHEGREKAITASIINNYVRMHIMPAPVKKKYGRVHLAYLIMLCTLKQSLSIACIQQMLPGDHSEEAARLLYSDFVRRFRQVTAAFVQALRPGQDSLLSGGAAVTAIVSTLSKDLTECLVQPPERSEEASL